ncbi:HPP family protein [Symbiobacterium thermophilum]|uniref:HPP family protein n=1 Tax=Symbiobacterium thermophilum TaxID=2734 RepID=UPI0035C66CA7
MIKKYLALMRGQQLVSSIPYPGLAEALVSGLGGFIVITLLTYVHFEVQAIGLFIVPFGASAVLAFAAPGAPFSQPRNILGGHLVAALAGVVVYMLTGSSAFWAMGLASGLAIALMVLTKTVHPPAGATALLPVINQIADPMWAISPVLAGAAVIVIVALLYNNLWARTDKYPRRYPSFWW